MRFQVTRTPDGTARRAPALVLLAMVAVGLLAAGCVTKQGAYPIEVFSEQHYSQAYRPQEQPRVPPAPEAVVFRQVGAGVVLDVPAKRQRPYDPKVAGELYRVNCAVCHGAQGLGDGALAPHLTSPQSYYATTSGQPYNPPPNLQQTRTQRDEDTVFSIITSGIVVMPRFGLLLTEEERWDLVRYIFDNETGLGR